MPKKTSYFLSAFTGETIEVQKKVKSMVFGSFTMFIMLNIGGIVQAMAPMNILVKVLIFFIAFSFLIPLIFIRLKKLNVANVLLSLLYILGTNVLFFFNDDIEHESEIYSLLAILFFGLFFVLLVSVNKKQIYLYIILGFISIWGFYIFKIVTGLWGFNTGNRAFSNTFGGSILLLFAGFLARSIIATVEDRLKTSLEEAEKNKALLFQFAEVLDESKNSIKIGEKLVNSTDTTLNEITVSNTSLINIKTDISALNNEMNTSRNVNNDLVTTSTELKRFIEEFNVTLTQSSSAIEEMTASINNITNIFREKNDKIVRLVNTASTGEKEMRTAALSVEEIFEQANTIFDIINVIRNVADQTDLLAMNAAIEAAHAGEYGKGFAVVADEIRKLAEQTDDNIKIVTSTLKKNVEDIKTAVEINNKAAEVFHNINDEIVAVKQSIDEVNVAMQELSSGTNEVLKGVSTTLEMSNSVSQLTTKVDSMFTTSNDNIGKLTSLSGDISGKIADIISNFEKIVDEVHTIKEIGNENITQIERLDLRMKDLNIE